MICPKCGREAEGKFCPSCGEKLPLKGIAPPDTQAVPYAQPYGGPAPVGAPYGEGPARQLYRKLASSPVFLIAVVVFTLELLLGAVSAFSSVKNFSFTGYSGSVPAGMEAVLRSVLWILTGLVMAAYALAVGAFWQIRINAKGQGPLRTVGLTIHRVLLIVALVLICLVLAFLLFACVAALVSGNMNVSWYTQQSFNGFSGSGSALAEELSGTAAYVVVVLVLIVALLVCALAILFFAKAIKTVGVVRRVVLTGQPDDRVSMLVMAMCILGAVGGVTTTANLLLGTQAAAVYTRTGASVLPAALSSALNIAVDICFALLLWRWREGMRALGVYKGFRCPAQPVRPPL